MGTTLTVTPCMWESDEKEMFPSIDRDRVFAALKSFHNILKEKRRKCGREILFAINKIDRKLECLGTGYGKYFHNIAFQQVL